MCCVYLENNFQLNYNDSTKVRHYEHEYYYEQGGGGGAVLSVWTVSIHYVQTLSTDPRPLTC